MKRSKPINRGRQLLTLTVVALPWFLRDHLATSLEVDSREVQQIMIGENAQQQREEHGEGLRELNRQLARIEIRQRQSSGELDEHQVEEGMARMLSSTFTEEGTALAHRVQSFEALLPRIAMTDTTRKSLADKAHAAGVVAQSLEAFDARAPQPQGDALVDQWAKAETHLREAYEQLLTEAERDRDASARLANGARFAAWGFTALAALMVGDWKKLFSGDGSGEDEEAPSEA